MSKLPLFIVTLLCFNNAFAQKVVERKVKLTAIVTEKYETVILADRQVKKGRYQALYNKTTAIATGNYTDDKKTGIWRFFDKQQKLLQIYNYDTNTLNYVAQEKTPNFEYVVDRTLNDTDRTTKPLRIGGRYYGYLPYLRMAKLPREFYISDMPSVGVLIELLVSPGGRLADFKVHTTFEDEERTQNIDPERLKEEDRIFIPATINNEAVACRVFIRCYVNGKGEIDSY